MSRFSGPQGTQTKYGPNKGVMKAYKLKKRKEAETRQAQHKEKLSQNALDAATENVVS